MPRRLGPLHILAIAALMLLAAYFLQRVADGGESPPEIPASELTPAAANATTVSASPSAGLTASAETRTATATPSAAHRDLARDESLGGHTLARHVSKSDAELRSRLNAEPDISAASTYTDRATAERIVALVLVKKSNELQKWEDRSGSRPNLALRYDTNELIGRSIKQGQSEAKTVDAAVVVLRWTGEGWYVLTSYPEDR